jgi:hypothetical protein
LTVPLVLPLLPLVIVIQLVLLVAVQLQPVVVVTERLAGPPLAPLDGLVGDTVNVHGDENEKVFEAVLRPTPPGPTAATFAS